MMKTVAYCALSLCLMAMPLAAVAQEEPTEPLEYTVFMLVKTTPDWLALPPEERFGFLGTYIEPLLAEHPALGMRFFDTEFFNGDVTDVIVFNTTELDSYRSVVEGLRETPFWDRYFHVVDVFLGIENAYAAYYDVEAIGQ
jgi:hypothetical protein